MQTQRQTQTQTQTETQRIQKNTFDYFFATLLVMNVIDVLIVSKTYTNFVVFINTIVAVCLFIYGQMY